MELLCISLRFRSILTADALPACLRLYLKQGKDATVYDAIATSKGSNHSKAGSHGCVFAGVLCISGRRQLQSVFIFPFLGDTGIRTDDPVSMLKTVLFGFMANGYISLRELEDQCKVNLRFMYLMNL